MTYVFQKAVRADIQSIIEIADMHYYTLGPSGFLVSKYDYRTVSNKINNPNSIVFVTKIKDTGEVVAFIIITTIYHSGLLNGLTKDDFKWENIKDKEIFEKTKHWHMEQGAVKKGYQNKGIGSFYYKEMFNMFPDHSFSSNVISKPIENRASLRIKDSHGFHIAAHFESHDYKQLKNYQSTLFVRNPQNSF